jgi:hypothetical protein
MLGPAGRKVCFTYFLMQLLWASEMVRAQSVILNPSMDTNVTGSILNTPAPSDGLVVDAETNTTAILDFDLSGIPGNATIDLVSVAVYMTSSGDSQRGEIDAFGRSGPFTQSDATTAGTPAGTFTGYYYGNYHDGLPVAAFLQSLLGTGDDLALRFEGTDASFRSIEQGDTFAEPEPRLFVDYSVNLPEPGLVGACAMLGLVWLPRRARKN